MNTPQKQTVYLPVEGKTIGEFKDRKYTEKDLKKIFIHGKQLGLTVAGAIRNGGDKPNQDEWFNESIESLQPKTEWEMESKEGYFFTPEQLNEYTANVIRQALENAAENTETLLWQNNEDLEIVSNRVAYIVGELNIKQSITNTFENTFEKFKV